MVPIGDTRKRFNVRFYIVAMIFLVFDVEIVFFYPWATIFSPNVDQNSAMGGLLLVEMIVFVRFCWSRTSTPGARAYLSGIEECCWWQ